MTSPGRRPRRATTPVVAMSAALAIVAGAAVLSACGVPAATAQLTPLETTVATGVPTTTVAAPAARATPTSMATTTTDGVPRQRTQPIAPPGDPDAPEDNPPVGRIAIADIALDEELGEGIRLATLDRGPGHWPGSAMPGEVGNVVIGGHRTSHGAEFRRLHELEPGDEMVLTSAAGSFSYRVSRTEIVGPEALWIVDPTDTATATLFACHPLGSTAERIVVYFDLAT